MIVPQYCHLTSAVRAKPSYGARLAAGGCLPSPLECQEFKAVSQSVLQRPDSQKVCALLLDGDTRRLIHCADPLQCHRVSATMNANRRFVRKTDIKGSSFNVRIEPTLTDAARCPNDSNAQKADFANFEERSLRIFAETFWSNRYWELAGYVFDLICCSAVISRPLLVALITKSGDSHCPELDFAILQSRSTCRSNQSSSSAS